MSHIDVYNQYRSTETLLGIKRHRYDDLVELAKKHAALAKDYAEKAKEQRESIVKDEQLLRELEFQVKNPK